MQLQTNSKTSKSSRTGTAGNHFFVITYNICLLVFLILSDLIQFDLYPQLLHSTFIIYIISVYNQSNMISTIEKKPKWEDYNCLHPTLIANLYSKNLTNPTSIQSEVFENYKHYYDFLVASQTGSGKTLAFAAPIISQLMHLSEHIPKTILCLVLTPTRELAQQIQSVIADAIKGTSIIQASVLGGLSIAKQIRVIQQKKPQIIVGTPGRISELINEQIISFSNLKYLVIDEADRMIEMGHYVQLDAILHKIFNPKLKQTFEDDLDDIIGNLDNQKLKDDEFYIMQKGKKKKVSLNLHSIATDKLFEVPDSLFQIANDDFKPKEKLKSKKKKEMQEEVPISEQVDRQILSKMKRRIFFISATLTREFKGTKYHKKKRNEEEEKNKKKQEESEYTPKLKALLSHIKFDSKPKIIDQSAQLFLPEKLKELYCFCDNQIEKISIMIAYLRDLPKNSKAIIFANTIKASKRVQFFVEHAGIKNSTLHSHMIQKQRLTKLEKFKKSNGIVLISTDVAARGLDFEITHVIQYSVPVNGDTYVHRVGRTARANRCGQALVLISKKEASKWEEITTVLGSGSSARKVEKYSPIAHRMKAITEQIEKYEWIRLNEQKEENKRIAKLNEMEAEQFGFEVDEDHNANKIDEEQERIMNHKIKNKIKKIQAQTQETRNKPGYLQDIGDGKVWKKNKLVMSLDEIKKLL